MRYRNSEMKIDQLVGYLNDEKINLSPAFQRGHVWQLKTRRKLVKNIVLGLPIPAIFLYKEAVGSRYSYNILDGKQRLESLILFIGDFRKDVKIEKWSKYFFAPQVRKMAGFAVDVAKGKSTFSKLSDDVLRDFREYSIPTIEITLDEQSTLDEVITLFVDINQQGESVNRFDIVKAMYRKDPLLKSVFGLLALEQRRGQDVHYKPRKNEFTAVLGRLQVIESIVTSNPKVDKMWEKLLEFVLFERTQEHRNPVSILKEFITADRSKRTRLSAKEEGKLRRVFRFLENLLPQLGKTPLFSDQTHAYTLVTSLLGSDLLGKYDDAEAARRLGAIAGLLGGAPAPSLKTTLGKQFRDYRDLSAKQTTHVSRRVDRGRLFLAILEQL